MSITSTLKRKEACSTTFPYLGVHADGDVVLFLARRVGVLVRHGGNPMSSRRVGDYSEDWNMAVFAPLEGTLTLSND